LVDLVPGLEPWSNLPEEPEARLRELRCRLREWRKMLPVDYSGVTAALRERIRELLKEHPELRDTPRRSRTRRRRSLQ
jgi:hypothetical protein